MQVIKLSKGKELNGKENMNRKIVSCQSFKTEPACLENQHSQSWLVHRFKCNTLAAVGSLYLNIKMIKIIHI